MSGHRRLNTVMWQVGICLVVLSVWQWGYDLHVKLPWLVPDLLDPYFISRPSDIFENFLMLSCIKSKVGVLNGWLNGDFDGNGVVDFDDYSLIDLAFNTQGSALRRE